MAACDPGLWMLLIRVAVFGVGCTIHLLEAKVDSGETLRRSMVEVGPGDTVYMRGGTYHEEIIGTSLHGSSGNPITITAYQNEQVTLDGSESW